MEEQTINPEQAPVTTEVEQQDITPSPDQAKPAEQPQSVSREEYDRVVANNAILQKKFRASQHALSQLSPEDHQKVKSGYQQTSQDIVPQNTEKNEFLDEYGGVNVAKLREMESKIAQIDELRLSVQLDTNMNQAHSYLAEVQAATGATQEELKTAIQETSTSHAVRALGKHPDAILAHAELVGERLMAMFHRKQFERESAQRQTQLQTAQLQSVQQPASSGFAPQGETQAQAMQRQLADAIAPDDVPL